MLTTLALIRNPSGTYSFVGRVPESLAHVHESGRPLSPEEHAKIRQSGPGFCPWARARTFPSPGPALDAAESLGYPRSSICVSHGGGN